MKKSCCSKQFMYFDGDESITFDLLEQTQETITVVVTNRGKISQTEYDIFKDSNGDYFEFGNAYNKIYLKNFKEIK